MKRPDFYPFLRRLKAAFIGVFDFSLPRDKEVEAATVETIKHESEFRGANLWMLIFAVFIASLGLNINSIVVIVGAMLIAPLMGPAMGFGLGVGAFDFGLIKSSLKSFGVVTFIGAATAFIFFFLFPYSEAPSELLLRTQPSVYDIFIALFGGTAGIVACSSRSKANIIAGVAVATALMPPLCTVGFGIAAGNMVFLLGGLYLYFFNSVFIGIGAAAMVRMLKISRPKVFDKNRENRISTAVVGVILLTFIPCLILSVSLFRQSIFEKNLRDFKVNELRFQGTHILDKEIGERDGSRSVKFVMVGESVPEELIRIALAKRGDYNLGDVEISVNQGLGKGEELDINTVKSVVLQDVFRERDARVHDQEVLIDSLRRRLDYYKEISNVNAALVPEIRTLFPYVDEISINYSVITKIDSLQQSAKQDTVALVYLKSHEQVPASERRKITDWLKVRTKQDNVRLLWQSSQR